MEGFAEVALTEEWVHRVHPGEVELEEVLNEASIDTFYVGPVTRLMMHVIIRDGRRVAIVVVVVGREPFKDVLK